MNRGQDDQPGTSPPLQSFLAHFPPVTFHTNCPQVISQKTTGLLYLLERIVRDFAVHAARRDVHLMSDTSGNPLAPHKSDLFYRRSSVTLSNHQHVLAHEKTLLRTYIKLRFQEATREFVKARGDTSGHKKIKQQMLHQRSCQVQEAIP
ncbi:hypothetical protein RvY_03014 [Ramazzottius varieornatus]|uniref:Uncharacterized protein n=1 Tax=Ramazzottius varieornatus TaxID=947166 RepID=A0A1D1UMF8_RAMVA|nr:hypothetical protein RvY_03014 [Ramazzottius varieornatus]